MSTPSNPDDHLPRRLDAGEDGSRGPAILLVDDHPFALATEALLLASMGYRRIGTAASAEAALRLMRADPSAVDVVIWNLNMPGMEATGFLRVLGSEGFEGGVILLSGEGERVLQTVQRLLGHGRLALLGALQKPASRERLDELLAGWEPSVAAASAAPAVPEPAPFSGDEPRTAHDRGQ